MSLKDEDLQFIVDPDTKEAVKIFNENIDKTPFAFSKLTKIYPKGLLRVVKAMMTYNPLKRPSASQLLKETVFDEIRSEKVESLTLSKIEM